jgi:hypothetical protein
MNIYLPPNANRGLRRLILALLAGLALATLAGPIVHRLSSIVP